ncbi:hypothetical protein [Lentzea sp. NPDC003310]|uniref:hypothetical protein n=1 Tax=Lentzea sp. NPDC003310 TaxID=3154447 RepID=UPI0033B69293
MNIEDELRGALDVSAPPPTTTLDLVVKRGRRRVFAQRAGAVLGAFAVVAGIGIGAATLNLAAPGPQQADRPDAGPTSVENSVGWPRVNTPPQIPYGTWSPASTAPPPVGRAVLSMPRCDIAQRKWAMKVPVGSLQLNDEYVQKWIGTVRERLPELQVSDLAPKLDGERYLENAVDLSDSGGVGSVRLAAGRFEGTPLQYADDNIWTSGDCQPPYRTTLPDGTIVQLHGVRAAEPFQTLLQIMEVFRPDGLMLQLELTNYSSKDLLPSKEGSFWERVGAGRATLPLTEEQFSRLGPAIAGVA